jgi:hypothetical protein
MAVKKDNLKELCDAVTAGLVALRDRAGLDAKLRDHLINAYDAIRNEFGIGADPTKPPDFSQLSDADRERLGAALGHLRLTLEDLLYDGPSDSAHVYAFAALTGLFSKQALEKLRELFSTVFTRVNAKDSKTEKAGTATTGS